MWHEKKSEKTRRKTTHLFFSHLFSISFPSSSLAFLYPFSFFSCNFSCNFTASWLFKTHTTRRVLSSSSLQSTRNEIRVKDIEDRSESSLVFIAETFLWRLFFFFFGCLTWKLERHALNNNDAWGAKNMMLSSSLCCSWDNKKTGDSSVDFVLFVLILAWILLASHGSSS